MGVRIPVLVPVLKIALSAILSFFLLAFLSWNQRASTINVKLCHSHNMTTHAPKNCSPKAFNLGCSNIIMQAYKT